MSILKVSLEDYTKYKYKKDLFNPRQEKLIKKKFKRYSKDLESGKGVRIGNLDRVLIPKKDLSAKELTKGLGFLPTRIAVPESGQTKFRTFRHPHSKHHIHSHRKYWTMHKDEHTSYTTMGWAKKLKKNPSMKKYEAGLPSTVDRNTTKASSTVEAFAKGMKHNIVEGVPGWVSYLKNRYLNKNRTGTVSKIKKELEKRNK